jgi:hypothetical protein
MRDVMKEFKNILNSFFNSNSVTLQEHAKYLKENSINDVFKKNLLKIFEGLQKIENNDENGIGIIQEHFMNLSEVFDYYKTNDISQIEIQLAETINNLNKENMGESYTNIITLLEQLHNTNIPKPLIESVLVFESENISEPVLNSEPTPEKTDGLTTPTEQEMTALEEGFNSGRKAWKMMREQGLSASKYSRELAEEKYSERTYKWTENWIKGFNEGCKFEEMVAKDKNPELFKDEKDS